MSLRTLQITDYKPISKSVAKVIVSYTGQFTKEQFQSAVGEKMQYLGAAVKNSFVSLSPGIAVGYVKANNEIRVPSKQQISANYRVLGHNILMDNNDKTLWDVQVHAGQKCLVRHGDTDLTALLASVHYPRNDVARLTAVTSEIPEKFSVCAFVDTQGDMDCGFVVASDETTTTVVSKLRNDKLSVNNEAIVATTKVEITAEANKAVTAALGGLGRKSAIEYYKQLYSYDPEYLALVIKQIEGLAIA